MSMTLRVIIVVPWLVYIAGELFRDLTITGLSLWIAVGICFLGLSAGIAAAAGLNQARQLGLVAAIAFLANHIAADVEWLIVSAEMPTLAGVSAVERLWYFYKTLVVLWAQDAGLEFLFPLFRNLLMPIIQIALVVLLLHSGKSPRQRSMAPTG